MAGTMIGAYLGQLDRYPLLSAEQEKRLAERVRRGDDAARSRLVCSNLRLVVSIAKKYVSEGVDIMDLIQEGNLGLMAAAAKFRGTFNTRFSTYAHSWITQHILRYVHSKTPVVSIPFRKEELLRTIRKTEGELSQRLGRKPTHREIAVFLGMPEEKVRAAMRMDCPCLSLSDEVRGRDGLTLGDTMADERLSVEQEFLRNEEARGVKSLVDALPWRERQVIRYRYSLANSGTPRTLRQVGEILGVTSETVRQLELKAIGRLRAEASRLSV